MKHFWKTLGVVLALALTASSCRSAPPETRLAGRFDAGYYAAPDGSWSVRLPFERTHPLIDVQDGADGTGGWFLTWAFAFWSHADVWVAPTPSIAELGGIATLADNGIASRAHESAAAGQSFRVLSRTEIEVQGRRGVRHVFETVEEGERSPPFGLKTSTRTSLVIEDLVDWDDRAMVRVTGAHSWAGDADASSNSAAEHAKGALESLEQTFRLPAERAR
ncbi:MAG: hypothetical protein IT453_22220 [Planctomycetes bacterium]|nr:hypothetical protein [Planctomycetota bacterium]